MSYIKIESEYHDLDKYENNIGNIIYCKKDTYTKHNPYGPAFTRKSGYKAYYIENKLHRLDGPARIYAYGREEYWINNKLLNKEEFDIHPERLKYLGKEHLICLK